MSYRIACIVVLLFLLFYWVGFHAVDLQPLATQRVCNVSFDSFSAEADERGRAMLDAFFNALLDEPNAEKYSIVLDPRSSSAEADHDIHISMRRAQWIIDHCRARYDLPASRFCIHDIDDNSSLHLPGFAGISLRLKRTGG
jgi:hypothetical protein